MLRTITLLSVDIDHATATGRVLLDGKNLLKATLNDRARIRRQIGMVFATPQPLPRSIFENLVFGPRLAGKRKRAELNELVESSLRAAQLWDEVKDRLTCRRSALSGGQQQRLCIARAIALEPEVMLLDEPCSGLDPISTAKIEQAMQSLKSQFTWVIVTNNTKQAARVSDRTAFFLLGDSSSRTAPPWTCSPRRATSAPATTSRGGSGRDVHERAQGRQAAHRAPEPVLRGLSGAQGRHVLGRAAPHHRVHRAVGCGKSTFLRTLNRMNETIRTARVEGEILLDGEDILAASWK